LIRNLQKRKLSVSGFLAKRSEFGGNKQVYEIYDLDSGESIPLASREPVKDWIKTGNFYFNTDAILMGKRILNDQEILHKDLVVVDEIGIFELDGKVWADSLSFLVRESQSNMIWVVRDTLIEKVIRKWNLQKPVIIDIERVSIVQAEKTILSVF
jgi:nucleoside-triphosphatase THEP1